MVENEKIFVYIKYHSELCYTGSLEVFHSVLNIYCPKRFHITLEGMIARMQLAVLDYNSDLNNTQATVKDGKRRSNFFSK